MSFSFIKMTPVPVLQVQVDRRSSWDSQNPFLHSCDFKWSMATSKTFIWVIGCWLVQVLSFWLLSFDFGLRHDNKKLLYYLSSIKYLLYKLLQTEMELCTQKCKYDPDLQPCVGGELLASSASHLILTSSRESFRDLPTTQGWGAALCLNMLTNQRPVFRSRDFRTNDRSVFLT